MSTMLAVKRAAGHMERQWKKEENKRKKIMEKCSTIIPSD